MNVARSILFEDNHLLVINKPPLLATMGAEAGQPSLVDEVKSFLKRKYQKPGNVYLGVVSRLDAFTSGVIVLAKTSKAASRLTQQFRDGSVDKTYWAQVPGELPRRGTLEHWLYKDDQQKRMVALTKPPRDQDQKVKHAKLEYRRIGMSSDPSISLLEIGLLTGRKHQIRVQFAQRGCPVVGDRKYGSTLPFPRGIALHSKSLKVIHPTLKTGLSFQADPPSWWNLDGFEIR